MAASRSSPGTVCKAARVRITNHRQGVPHVGQDHHQLGADGAAQQVQLAAGELIGNVADRAEAAVQDPPPQHGGHGLGQDPGNDDQGPEKHRALDLPVQKRSQSDAQGHDQHQGQDDILNGVEDVLQSTLFEDRLVVLKTYELPHLGVIGGVEAVAEGQNDGNKGNADNQQKRRCQKQD